MSHKAPLPNTWANMARILVGTCVIAAVALSVTNTVTEKPRLETEKKNKIAAIGRVLTGFDNNPATELTRWFVDKNDSVKALTVSDKVDDKEKFRVCEVYPATKGGKTVGYAITSFTEEGYSGQFFLMVGISFEGKITDISVIDHKETPGLGTEMAKPKFKDQFKGKNPENWRMTVKKDGGDVDQITAATISSRAFCDATIRAFAVYRAVVGSSNSEGDVK